MGGEKLSLRKPSQDRGEKATNKRLKVLFFVCSCVRNDDFSKQRSVKVMNDSMSMKLADQMA